MTTTRFVSLSLPAGCPAFAAGSAAPWLLGRTASVTGTGDAVRAADLPSNLGFRVVADEGPGMKPGSMLQALRRMLRLQSA